MIRIKKIDGIKTTTGYPYLFGAKVHSNGVNFALFSKYAKTVTLMLFDQPEATGPSHRITFDPRINRTGDVWHIFIFDITPGQLYGYAVDGPYNPAENGSRFNKHKLLLDPYALVVNGDFNWDNQDVYGYQRNSGLLDLSFSEVENYAHMLKSTVVDTGDFDWEDDKPLNTPMQDSIIYEMHTRAFTFHPSSQVTHPGTYKGIIEKIDYLKDLGITAIELLPVHLFNPQENIRCNPLTGERLVNFWGYSTLSFFAPQLWYASQPDGVTALREFKEMVKALHKAGIEIILDVVFNHSGEGNEYGPTVCYKGLDNAIYYMLEDGRHYKNYSGCGNTFNCNHPVVKRLIIDSLRYWVFDMHVDGFRFDLAAILGRDKDGHWLPDHSVLSELSHDPILANTKIIAESWDAAGLYKVGGFPSRWAEWNGKFRDDVRSFVKGDAGMVPEMAKRLTGSADLFYFGQRRPYHSINFITAHDGFSLNDLYCYNNKQNEANGEYNQDGENHNLSWNCGVEGPTKSKRINALRRRLMKNSFAILMLSQGTPMMLSGDELRFSKNGNNNTYCQDNELNWLDWGLIDKDKEFLAFCKYMIAFRKKHPALRRKRFFTGKDASGNKIPDISWHGTDKEKPDWGSESRALAFMLDGERKDTGASRDDNNIYVAMNSFWKPLNFRLPDPGPGNRWHLCVNTYENPSCYADGKEKIIKTRSVAIASRALAVFIAK